MLCTEFMDGPSLEQIKCMPEAMIGRVIVAVLQVAIHLMPNVCISHSGIVTACLP
jgi:hypothetical protein